MSAFSVTALELVNRIHRRRRMPAVGSFVADEDVATLNSLNSAVEEVMTGRNWEWNIRHNGQLALISKLTGLGIIMTAGANTALLNLTGLVDSDLVGDFVVRMLPTGISEYANTSLRVNSSSAVNFNLSLLTLEVTFPTTSNGSAELLYGEYLLPDTVESVVRATYQEYPLTLNQIDPSISYEELYPQPHANPGPPETIAVGGFDISSYVTGETAPDPALRLAIWPIPDDDYIINYSYYYRHPQLVTITDTLEGVPHNVVSRIVDHAAADMKIFYDLDYEALKLKNDIRGTTAEIYSRHGGSQSRRKSIRNWDSGRGTGGFRSGFPGKLIG